MRQRQLNAPQMVRTPGTPFPERVYVDATPARRDTRADLLDASRRPFADRSRQSWSADRMRAAYQRPRNGSLPTSRIPEAGETGLEPATPGLEAQGLSEKVPQTRTFRAPWQRLWQRASR